MIDDILSLRTQFSLTDDHRYANIHNWISMKIDQIRAQLIVKEFQETGNIDYNWLTDLGRWPFSAVNMADDPTVTYCCSDLSKSFIPNVISLLSKNDPDVDLGIYTIRSACGTKEYYSFPMAVWKMIPKEHVRSRFNYYSRVSTAIFVNQKVSELKIVAILASPEDGVIISSHAVASGGIASGTVYIVKGGQIFYNNAVYTNNDTFTGSPGVTVYTGTGTVYLNSQAQSITELAPYPIGFDMARVITIEIMKEFGIEEGSITDILNDSVDDTQTIKEKS